MPDLLFPLGLFLCAAWEALYLLGVSSKAENYFGSFGERLGCQLFIGVFREINCDERIDGLAVLTRVDFNTLVFALEEFDGG